MVNISRLANPFIQWPFTSKLIGWIFMAYKYGGVLPNKKHQKPLSGPWNLIPPSIDPPLWLRCSKSPLVASWRPGGKNQLAEIEQKATVWKPMDCTRPVSGMVYWDDAWYPYPIYPWWNTHICSWIYEKYSKPSYMRWVTNNNSSGAGFSNVNGMSYEYASNLVSLKNLGVLI